MLAPLRDKNRRGQVAQPQFMPFPWRGLNTRDRLEVIGSEWAQTLDNINITNGQGEVRKGYTLHATCNDDTADVKALLVYNGASTDKLFAAAGGNIDDISSGNPGAADVSGLNGNDWISTMYSTTSGTYMVIANGTDSVRYFDGSTWTTPTITGVTSANLSFVSSHKGRLWFCQKSTLDVWYLAANAVSGTATKFPLGALCERGGEVIAIGTWSSDSGDGLDDRLVFVTSEGEIIIYSGIDPASDYVLVGIFQTDKPVSKRCLARFGGELLYFSVRKPESLAEIVQGITSSPDSFADVVRPDFDDAWRSYSAQTGWEAFSYPARGWLIFNVPTTYGQEISRQYVYQSNAWVRHRYQPALTWAEFGGNLYFGSDNGRVYQADTGQADDDGAGGTANIIVDVIYGWSMFGTPQKKAFRGAQITIVSDTQVFPTVEMLVDYKISQTTTANSVAVPTGAIWDVSQWDVTAWDSTSNTSTRFFGLSRVGMVGALRIQLNMQGPDRYRIEPTFVLIESGGVI